MPNPLSARKPIVVNGVYSLETVNRSIASVYQLIATVSVNIISLREYNYWYESHEIKHLMVIGWHQISLYFGNP